MNVTQLYHAARARSRTTLGLLRSLVIYRHPFRQRSLRYLYRSFVQPGDVVFDIGAHLGDRTRAFASLGAQVVAFEPQPHLRAWLERLEGSNSRVTIRGEAVGAEAGAAQLSISQATPTVSTMATVWRQGIGAANETFRNVRWEEQITVPVVTLDAMIAAHGLPAFCKIDVEGFELDVLQGLSQPLPALSVEFVAGSLDGSKACIEHLEGLRKSDTVPAAPDYEYNVILGEGRELLFSHWIDASKLIQWLDNGAGNASSGDIYVRQCQ